MLRLSFVRLRSAGSAGRPRPPPPSGVPPATPEAVDEIWRLVLRKVLPAAMVVYAVVNVAWLAYSTEDRRKPQSSAQQEDEGARASTEAEAEAETGARPSA